MTARTPHPGTVTLIREARAIVILLERFGDLLTDALDAAGRGADDEFAVAVAERGRVTAAISTRLAAIAITRQVARRDGATGAEIAAALRPVDAALHHAHLLHDRVADEPEDATVPRVRPPGVLTLVR